MRRTVEPIPELSPTSLRVILHGKTVGTLAQTTDGVLAFQYDRLWLRNGFSISPFSLPLEDKVFIAKPHPLDGVFGVFDDSLPDGWGRLLVDRTLRTRNIDPHTIGPLARLAIVGKSGMGALEYEPEAMVAPTTVTGNLDDLARECATMLSTDYSNDLDTLFALGGSSGGARPKILTVIDGQDWIVKFPSSHDPRSIGLQEYEIARVAQTCGIVMPDVQLLPSKQCEGYFAVKRFDRMRNEQGDIGKAHMVSVGALLETSHRIPNLDYDLLMRLTLRLTNSMAEVERLYRQMVFNVLIGNKDDHAKNFTFVHDDALDAWTLSPAYDITHNAGMNGEHATMVNGKGTDITIGDMVQVATRAGISQSEALSIAREIQERVHATLALLPID